MSPPSTLFHLALALSATAHACLPLLLPAQRVGHAMVNITGSPTQLTTPAMHYTVSQTGRSAIFANLIVTYPGTTLPNVIATWVATPTTRHPAMIKLTRDGVSQIITLPTPVGVV